MIPINPHYRPIYLDYMATTPVDPRVIQMMFRYLGPDGEFGNASNTNYQQGERAYDAIARARSQIAEVIHANENEIVWTSGATESNNLAILGAARFYKNKGRHIITLSTEHLSVIDPCAQLEKEGFEVTYLSPEQDGLLSLEKLKSAIRDETILVSIMHANNEIGVIQDLKAIGNIVKSKGALFHVDAVQSAGKILIDVDAYQIDLLSLSGHKLYAPKGIGALYVRSQPRIRIEPIILGGGQQNNLRSGTLPTAQIVAMGEAFAIAQEEMQSNWEMMQTLRTVFLNAIANLDGITHNGSLTARMPNNINLSVAGVEGESLRLSLSPFMAVSSRSACSASSGEPSYVLRALGVSRSLANASLRISFGRFTQPSEVQQCAEFFVSQVNRLRRMSPHIQDKELS